jgi:hypothetical protein
MFGECRIEHTNVSVNKLPGTMPSSTAALVAFKASVTLSFFSPTSASLAPPICNSQFSDVSFIMKKA